MTKKSRQKYKYVENEKSFQDEAKSIFHQFFRSANKKKFGSWESNFNKRITGNKKKEEIVRLDQMAKLHMRIRPSDHEGALKWRDIKIR